MASENVFKREYALTEELDFEKSGSHNNFWHTANLHEDLQREKVNTYLRGVLFVFITAKLDRFVLNLVAISYRKVQLVLCQISRRVSVNRIEDGIEK